jgi:hypothetical protein
MFYYPIGAILNSILSFYNLTALKYQPRWFNFSFILKSILSVNLNKCCFALMGQIYNYRKCYRTIVPTGR